MESVSRRKFVVLARAPAVFSPQSGPCTVGKKGLQEGPPQTADGSTVKVKGRVSQVASFGSRSFGLHLQQEHLNVHLY